MDQSMALWRKRKYVYWHTHLDRGECVKRLSSEVNPWFDPADILRPLAKLLGRKFAPVCGSIRGDDFRLRKQKMWGYHNSHLPILYGKLVDEPVSGTRIEGYFDVELYTRVWEYIMLGVAVLMAGTVAVLSACEGDKCSALTALLVIVGIPLVIRLASKLFWWIDSRDVGFLTEFVEKMLDAKPVDARDAEMLRIRH